MKIESNCQELLPVTARAMALAVDYAHGHVISVHRHSHAQLMREPGEQVTVAAWAQQLAITERSLHRLFQKQTGMRFGQWRQQARLLRALEQLAQGVKVIDVAMDNGYTSQSAFAAMFKKHFGTTPTDFYRTAPTAIKKNAAMHQ